MFLPYLKQLRCAASHLILGKPSIMLPYQIMSLGLFGFQNSHSYPVLHNNNCILGRENVIKGRITQQIVHYAISCCLMKYVFCLGNNIRISNKSLMGHKKVESASCGVYHSCVNMEQQLNFLSPFHKFQILALSFKIEMILCFKSQLSHKYYFSNKSNYFKRKVRREELVIFSQHEAAVLTLGWICLHFLFFSLSLPPNSQSPGESFKARTNL